MLVFCVNIGKHTIGVAYSTAAQKRLVSFVDVFRFIDFDTSRILSFISIQFFTISVSAVCAEVVGIREVFVMSTHNAVELQIYTLKLKCSNGKMGAKF